MASAAASRGGTSLTLSAVIVLLLTLVGAGAGFAVGTLLIPPPPGIAKLLAPSPGAATGEAKPAEAGNEAPSDLPAGADVPVPMIAVPFPPILTNLAEPKGTWIRLEGSLLLKKETDDPAALLTEKAGEQFVTFLRTLKLNQIEGPSGFLHLREDLNGVVSTLSGGQVREVLIDTMVLE